MEEFKLSDKNGWRYRIEGDEKFNKDFESIGRMKTQFSFESQIIWKWLKIMKHLAQILKNFDEIPKTIEVITTDSPALATLSAILKLDLSKKSKYHQKVKIP